MNNDIIYLDNNSTTPLDPRVLDAMLPYFTTEFGNASSSHNFGINSKKAIESAKQKIAQLIKSDSNELIMTSGATESINIALKGLALHPTNKKKHIITVSTEHNAVLDTCKYLETIGFEVDYLPVNKDGLIDLKDLEAHIKDDTLLVCTMWVNNETGVIQPIFEISELVKRSNALFMTDATQAVGKIEIDVVHNNIDIMCFSSHKIYGARGIGALYLNSKTVGGKNIAPLHHGGGHENGLRSGTLNVPAIVGFGKASEIAIEEMHINSVFISKLCNMLEFELLKIDGAFINGGKTNKLYNTISICIPGLDANVFIGKNKNIAVSNGSACTSALLQPSHVLNALGLTENESLQTLRISIGKMNTESDIYSLLEKIYVECKNGSNLL
ncbi:cysteine desulfurase family protein [Flavobacterium sp. FlaQc-47]|uniref:cysteine desulfurase family protein n=1 Tax=Flavobacterium sp. FlaQc-47 TaxID=3374180 RepID=UPI003757A59D